MHAWTGSATITAVLLGAGCGFVDPPADRPPRSERLSAHGGHVTTSEEFRGRGNVLGVIQRRMAGMQVRRPPSETCPEITLRGQTSLTGSNSPVIYVDGTRTTNTCILDMLNADDVERVEVYPNGIAPGGTHRNSPTGLILVFLRRE
jgi:hypothetical protein